MAGFQINITMDIDKFEAALTNWSDDLPTQNEEAAVEGAEFIKELVQANLLLFPHPRGTPSLAPEWTGPVGYITGQLRDSVDVVVPPIRGYAKVQVTAIYARIQEIGGWTGNHHTSYIPPRPYFRPMVEEVDTTGPGGMEHIFWEHWRRAMIRAVAY